MQTTVITKIMINDPNTFKQEEKKPTLHEYFFGKRTQQKEENASNASKCFWPF